METSMERPFLSYRGCKGPLTGLWFEEIVNKDHPKYVIGDLPKVKRYFVEIAGSEEDDLLKIRDGRPWEKHRYIDDETDAISTDCRSEEGITVGLIDSLISVSRVLADRDMSSPAAQEALKDLWYDEDISVIYSLAELASQAPR